MSQHDEDGADLMPAYEDMDPLQQAAFDASSEEDQERPSDEYCSHCGKAFEEFSDLGCEYCDRRHPGFGTV